MNCRAIGAAILGIAAAAASAQDGAQSLRTQRDLTPLIAGPDGVAAARSVDAHFGKMVELPETTAGAPHVAVSLRMDGGTLSFWVKPKWQPGSPDSHTLMSARWIDPRGSYLVLSEGWWEPGGSGRLYFVASNEDIVHCSSAVRLPHGVWSLITATWASGARGFCKLYVDDELRAESSRPWSGSKSLDEIELGTDAAASNARGRPAFASISGLKVLHRPVTHREVIARYQAEEDPQATYAKKWAWLDAGPAGSTAAARAGGSSFRRAIFDEDHAWAGGPAFIDERLRRLSAAGFNEYIPCVWHGGGSLFPSLAAAPDPRFARRFAAGWDPLAYLLARAHARGIRVYPWFTVVLRQDAAHPEWAPPGTPKNAYDVHQAGFRKFVENLMLDVVSRYDVDGINLDYIRAMGVCTSESCQRSYRSRTGRELMADFADGAPDPAARERLQEWQDEAVGEIVRDFAGNARRTKPDLTISVDGYAVASEQDRSLEGRNEISWANRGWIDTIFHMDYEPEINLTALNAARSRLADPEKLRLLAGNYDSIDGDPQPRSGKWLSAVLNYAERTGQSGIGIYLYGQLSEAQINALQSGF
jgi:Glycosyl hydrolase-like 10/Concanavalin A-like lectin/glucanases superfamily